MQRTTCWLVCLTLVWCTWTGAEPKPNDVAFAEAMGGERFGTDRDVALLVGPDHPRDETGVAVASVPPRIDFVPTGPVEPHGQGEWSTWGDLLVADDGRVYFAIGDHGGVNGRCSLWEYNPADKSLRQAVDVWRLLGLEEGDFGEGKIHGRIDQARDGNIYFVTYWGLAHVPGTVPGGWDGSHIVMYDPRTGGAEDLGAPFRGETWPMTALDPERGNLFCCGVQDYVMCYNVFERRMLYGGALPNGWAWFARSTMPDPRTGRFYGSNRSINDPERRTGKHRAGIIAYDPARNRFQQTGAQLPDDPETGAKQDEWRAYTRTCDAQGVYYGCTDKGVLFAWDPDNMSIKAIDLNWGQGYYCTALALSPGGRYLYYSVGVHGNASQFGAPVVQYDLQRRRKKVIAYLHPFYAERYRYNMGGPFGSMLTPDGATLYMNWNGRFCSKVDGESFGDVALLTIHIPASEREE